MRGSTKYIFLGQISLFVFLFICFLLIPHFALESNEGGVSNYGLYAKTVIPYTLAFGLSGVFTLLGAKSLSNRSLRTALYAVGFLFLLVLASTYFYKINHALSNVHEYASATLLIVELVLGTWFALWKSRSLVSIIALTVQYLGFILTILNNTHIIHKLFIAEIVASFGFSVLVVTTTDSAQDYEKTRL